MAVLSASTVSARSLGSVLERHGYLVTQTDVSRDPAALDDLRAADAVIVTAASPRLPDVELCRRLLRHETFDPTTPLLVIVGPECTRNQRLELLDAGAWETATEPLDGELLLLKLQRYMRMRRVVGRLNAQCMVDSSTGLYTWDGLVRRAREVVALAIRRQRPLAFVAVTLPDVASASSADPARPRARALTGRIWRETSRATDIVGVLGGDALVCLAPDADDGGARALVGRLRAVLRSASSGERGAEFFRAGYCVACGTADQPIEPVLMLRRAAQHSRDADSGAIRGEVL